MSFLPDWHVHVCIGSAECERVIIGNGSICAGGRHWHREIGPLVRAHTQGMRDASRSEDHQAGEQHKDQELVAH